MDLLATVRKEGSRGGRGDFKWSDVETSSHRENYLGHSLMAPVGRWQKGRDLNWYVKPGSDSNVDEDPAAKAARERKEEIRRVKEAEEEALARALGLPVTPRHNPNTEELGTRREVGNVLKKAAADEDTAASRGVGYGRVAGVSAPDEGQSTTERLEGTTTNHDKELQHALREYKRRHGDRKYRSRSRSRHRHREDNERRHRGDRHRRGDRHHTATSPRRERSARERSRSLSPDRERDNTRGERRRNHSPSYRRYEDNWHDREGGHERSRRR
ncbi:hypothetical protein PV04_03077 [Phialophora macrospora]|uniref:Multiple myeloma tumor-associated protein 2-like N-terminal domain-containing protein n=1 Tax=Phialophora macrospora TaxID=1851006 RepID=A0A0D2FWI1_9EURO|nr:hypothetical protein PV04_03077 [Phialophora macrospora]